MKITAELEFGLVTNPHIDQMSDLMMTLLGQLFSGVLFHCFFGLILPACFHPPNGHCSGSKGSFPIRKSSPHQERKSRVSNQLPQPFGVLHKYPMFVSTLSNQKKLRHIEISRNKEEKQGLPIATTQQEQSWSTVTCCPADFATVTLEITQVFTLDSVPPLDPALQSAPTGR